ncbi:DUF695 domain-containing protein [Mucilaginibacter flavus]|uniref:DUF695 domain-containing protein n=1 Tax=Mucilaginibacter flavus TaxID=931504 RepID=UPI0025B2FBFE|nr:DUF695 domain-containing protein [Mucilaginibacter flavus]MDN3579893.1 DUF695 domain-containing protein [Mucilaginibacter flavus]
MMIEDMPLSDAWVETEFDNVDGLPVWVRYRPNIYNFMDTGLYNQRLDVIFAYQPNSTNQLPDGIDLDLMERVEEVLRSLLEQDNQSILTFVFTGENERWWGWYTTDIDIAGERLNIALAQFEELPITIIANDDPDWSEYTGVLDDFSEEE